MPFELGPAVLAGFVGGVTMIVARLGLRAAGMPLRMDVTRIWGTLVGVRGRAERPVGVVIHVAVSIAVAMVYAAGFDLADSTNMMVLWGLLAALLHWLIAGLMMSVLPVAHPEIPGERFAPGAFVKNFGKADVIGLFTGHLTYGVVVAIVYTWCASGTEGVF